MPRRLRPISKRASHRRSRKCRCPPDQSGIREEIAAVSAAAVAACVPYLVVGAVLLLWIWQDIFLAMTIQTIPYSHSRTIWPRGEVTECPIREDQIDGAFPI